MLSNFQLGTHALLQTFLVGQPEFRNILRSPQFNQLRQRVIAACHIAALDAEDTRQYVEHRLRLVGWRDSPVIPAEVHAAVHEASGGIPRRINLIFDRLLLAGYLSERREFTAAMAKEVAAEIAAETMAADSGVGPALAPVTPLPLARRGPAAPSPIDEELHQIKAAIERLEGENRSALGTFRQFLDWLRAAEGKPDKRA